MTDQKKLTKEGGYAAQGPLFQMPVGLAQTLQQQPPAGPPQSSNGMQIWMPPQGGSGGAGQGYQWSPQGGLQALQQGSSGAPNASSTATPTQPSNMQTFNPYTYGRNTSEFDFLAEKGVPGRVMTIDQILAALASGKGPRINGMAMGGSPRQPAGPVTGPGGPKDDLVGPIALSNKEYVLPVEMISHFGGGDYNHGLAGLESLRKKLT